MKFNKIILLKIIKILIENINEKHHIYYVLVIYICIDKLKTYVNISINISIYSNSTLLYILICMFYLVTIVTYR